MYDLLSGLNERLLANLIVQPIEESYNATGLLFKHTWFYAVPLVGIHHDFLSVKNINSFEPNFEASDLLTSSDRSLILENASQFEFLIWGKFTEEICN